ncbi:hypothetical protein BGX27_003224 [Mortierella sp. AM989]|nr:hypothetical protein BGX27_003224 [Mortierella sp. AM989]
MQIRAPFILERIFEDFFADSPLRLQEEEQERCQQLRQTQLLNHSTHELNQMITGGENESNNSIVIQRLDSLQVHKAAEKARRQAKWDAVRMLGVLYALDKTHIGPSSSSMSALVLSGASDIIEQPPPTNDASDPNSKLDPHQISISSLSSTAISPAAPCSSTTETQFHQQQFTQQVSPGPVVQRQLIARKTRRSLSQEGHDFPRISSPETDLHRPMSHKRNIRNRPSPDMGIRDNDTPSCGGHRRDRSLSQSYGECMWTSSSQPHSSASSPYSPPSSESSWQESTSTSNSHIANIHDSVQQSSSLSGNKFIKQQPIERQEENSTMAEGEWEGTTFQQESGNINEKDIEMSDPLVNMNESCREGEALASGSNNSRILTENCPILNCEVNRHEHKETASGPCLRHHRSAAASSRSRALPILRTPSAAVLPPTAPMPSQSQFGASMIEGINCQNEYQPQYLQPILNRSDKIAFLTKYTDRMHRKLQALEVKDWRNEDIQRKKTYQLMIQHNDKTGEKDLVDFYLGRYGGSVQSNQEQIEQQEQQQHHSIAPITATMAM